MSDSGKRRFWGWGVEGAGPTREQQAKMAETIATRFGATVPDAIEPPTIDEVELREPRCRPPTPSRTSSPPTPRNGRVTPTASRSATFGVGCTETSPNRLTS